MTRFWTRGREDRPDPTPTGSGADWSAPASAATAVAASATLEIEELEPRLTPDYTGYFGGGSGQPNPPPGRTVGWGC